jgi:hypothetical protein
VHLPRGLLLYGTVNMVFLVFTGEGLLVQMGTLIVYTRKLIVRGSQVDTNLDMGSQIGLFTCNGSLIVQMWERQVGHTGGKLIVHTGGRLIVHMGGRARLIVFNI